MRKPAKGSGPPRKPNGRTDSIELACYDRLGVTPEAVAALPQIRHVLAESGVLRLVWDFLLGSDDPSARALLEARSTLNKTQQAKCPIEALCLAAEVPPRKALEVIMGAVWEQSSKAGDLLYAANHKNVVQAALNTALVPGKEGTKERENLFKHASFVPVNKNTVVFGTQNNIGQQTNQVAILPPVEDRVRRLSERFNAGEAPVALLAPIQDEGDDLEEEES